MSNTHRIIPLLILLLLVLAACGGEATPSAVPPTNSPEPTRQPAAPTAAQPVANTLSGADACADLVDTVLAGVQSVCDATGRNQVCYGNQNVGATLRDLDVSAFDSPGDIINLLNVVQLTVGGLDTGAAQWGFAVLRLQANLPDNLPGENVTFLLFGNTEFGPQDGSLQAFYLRTGLSMTPDCAAAPADGLLVQTPSSDVRVEFTLNGAQFQLGSTAFIRAEPDDRMLIQMLEGQAEITADNQTETVPAGFQSAVPLDASGVASGAPSAPEPLDRVSVGALPVSLLERPVQIGQAVGGQGRVLLQIDGAVAQGGDVVEYTFEAQAGQQIFFDGDSLEGGDLRAELLAPDGSQVFSYYRVDSDYDTVTLEQAGTYTIHVQGVSEEDTGTYHFRLWEVPVPEAQAAQLTTSADQPFPITGTVETPGSYNLFTLEAQAGQQIFFDGDSAEGGDIRAELLAPDGSQVFSYYRTDSDYNTMTLEQGGTYTLRVYAVNDNTGTYRFLLWAVSRPEAQPAQLTASADQSFPISGEVETPGAYNLFTLDVEAGQQIFFDGDSAEGGDIRAELLAPDGSQVFSYYRTDSDYDTMTLAQGGTYTLRVYAVNDNTGTYRFRLWAVSQPEAQPAQLTASADQSFPISGEVATPGAYTLFTLEAQAGQQVFFDGDSAEGGDIRAALLAPDGSQVFSYYRTDSDYDAVTLEQGGTYTLRVYAVNDNTGTYRFRLWAVPQPEAQPAQFSSSGDETFPISGAIETPGAYDLFTLQGQAGQQVFFDGGTAQRDDQAVDIRAALFAPDGSTVFEYYRVDATYNDPLTLPTDGSYTLRVYGINDTTGSYAFRLRTGG